MNQPFVPLLEVWRGDCLESLHQGAFAIVNAEGELLACAGDPSHVTFLRSSAKPFQALPFVEHGGVEAFDITPAELALICASHDGAAIHLNTVRALQEKIGIAESELQCGAHWPADAHSYRALILSGREPSPNYNNCSGKHTGMLAHARLHGWSTHDYLDPRHPLQKEILQSLAEMCDYPRERIQVAIDGCSAPTFALPLYHAALGIARLCDPRGLPERRAWASRQIVQAMIAHPEMVDGEDGFDTLLMRAARGRLLSKGGAEGFQVIGILPDALAPGSPGIGIALKIADGDLPLRRADGRTSSRARPRVVMEILRQMGLSIDEAILAIDPLIRNHRNLVVGSYRAVFRLDSGRWPVDRER
jgi:L-asparaginase II